MATGSTPTSTPTPGTVVHFDVVDPYAEDPAAPVEFAGVVVASDTDKNRVRVLSFGPIGRTAEFAAGDVRIP